MGDSLEELLTSFANNGRDWVTRQTCKQALGRIRELEAEVYVVREASENWRECAEDWRKRAERAETENARLQEKIDAWKMASGLVDGSGDPDGIEPEHLERDLQQREAENARLREAGDQLRTCAVVVAYGPSENAPIHWSEFIEAWDEAKRGTHG